MPVRQFSHEIGHILCGYREGDQSNHWFEETICETAPLFALGKLSEDWKTSHPTRTGSPMPDSSRNTPPKGWRSNHGPRA